MLKSASVNGFFIYPLSSHVSVYRQQKSSMIFMLHKDGAAAEFHPQLVLKDLCCCIFYLNGIIGKMRSKIFFNRLKHLHIKCIKLTRIKKHTLALIHLVLFINNISIEFFR